MTKYISVTLQNGEKSLILANNVINVTRTALNQVTIHYINSLSSNSHSAIILTLSSPVDINDYSVVTVISGMISRSIDNDTSTYEAPLYLKRIVDANNNKIRILSVHVA